MGCDVRREAAAGQGVNAGCRLGWVALGLWLVIEPGCRTLPRPTFPDHAGLYQRLEYARGAGAVGYVGRLGRTDARVELLRDVDGYLLLYRQLRAARARTEAAAAALPADAPADHRDLYRDEVRRLDDAALDLGRLISQHLLLASGERVIEVLPELEEAARLCAAGPAPGLKASELLDAQRRLGSGPAACGAETGDFVGLRTPPPQVWVEAQRVVQDAEDGVVVDARKLRRSQTLLQAGPAQRQALAQYGMPRGLVTREDGGLTYRFQIGGLLSERRPGSTPVDLRPRVLRVECDFDQSGRLLRAHQLVLNERGERVHLFR